MNVEQQNQARDNIKKLMEEQGLSQPKLSDKAGIAFGTLSRILRGKQDLTIQTAEKIADALGLSVYDLTETDYSPVNTSVRGYLEFNGEIKRINSFKEVEAFVRKYREDVLELPKKVREDAKQEKENTKVAALKYLHDLFDNTVDDEKLEKAKEKMSSLLDQSVSSNDLGDNIPNYKIKGSKVIDLSKLDVEGLQKELKTAEYKSVEIEDLREFIEKVLQQMINRNTTRLSFSERYQSIINRYNAGSTENEDYYEQLLQLIEDLKKENNRAYEEGLTEEELEIYDLLIMGKHLTKAEEQKVKLAAKNLFNTLMMKKAQLLVIEWYKDEQTKALVRDTISAELDKDLPDAYDKESFNSKTNLLLNHFMDMSVQGYGWVA